MVRNLLVTLLLLAASAGCGDLKSIASFAFAVNREFHLPVKVNVSNGQHMTITFENAPADHLKDSLSRGDFAYLVARFAKAHYAKADSLSDVTIAFRSVSSYGPVTITNDDTPFVFAIRNIK